ncbi:hypothetical protein VFPPC_15462 [Pochonia chlamydosporia 170]|uniref:Uncharacterized protein n=1 Tax=Pochonia chlamydosporia 170 TaxID=1380566 RepID=A0A179FVK0_METCM|nr:hypothetical protein VFPPC_15462 [Pochonia chlamydosporia 170]OAQ69642.1 hypothetical protein VFPPC_15462 [Pochonia chlamydosporia 170]
MEPASVINTRKMRYTGRALSCLKSGRLNPSLDAGNDKCLSSQAPFSSRHWNNAEVDDGDGKGPAKTFSSRPGRRIGPYPLTSHLASWVIDAFMRYSPSNAGLDLVRPFSDEFHEAVERERATSTGLHDLNLMELTYQVTLEIGAEILLTATDNGNVSDIQDEYHSSNAARDDHFSPWGKLLTGLVCDPPIISQFPFYLMMCQSFGLESDSSRENYVYSALTGVDWAKGKNVYSDRFRAFEENARASVPSLDDKLSGVDRSFWRISLAYLSAMNKIENSREFTTPRGSHINTPLDPYLLMAVRGFDTIGSAYMCSDGASYLDNAGMDSLIGSAVPNDVMDLHTDILTGETRNVLRLLYPNGQSLDQAIKTMSTVFSGMLCELFRGHKRARFEGREDGRIAATSPPYSFCRARHRRIFEVMESYIDQYPQFWDWTWEIYEHAKHQITEAGLNELLIDALHRGIDQTPLPDSQYNGFYDSYFEMIENRQESPKLNKSLGVKGELGDLVRQLHHLWHIELRDPNKKPGWGRRFDEKSDALFKKVGEYLGVKGGITDEVYQFAIAYGRLSMALPYIAYHTIDAIIIVHGVKAPK